MNRARKYFLIAVIVIPGVSFTGYPGGGVYGQTRPSADTTSRKIDLPYPFRDYTGIPTLPQRQSGLYLRNPSNITSTITYDPQTNQYIFTDRIGTFHYRLPSWMSAEEYRKYDFEQSIRKYWRQRASGETGGFQSALIPKIYIESEAFDKVFGTNTIDIRPQGTAELIFGINSSKIDNPQLSEKLRRVTTFDFQEKIQMNVTGSIGDKMKLGVNYNTEATFDFENKTKLEYAGKEDEIIQKIEAGNVTMPLTGSLITGSQSLFGLKTELQFGKLSVTNVFSQQKGETSVIEVKGGAELSEFEVFVDEYDANRHFFLSHYFRNMYDQALKNLPVINSAINITRIEVWITNKYSNFENSRNIVAFMDLAENSRIFNSHFVPNPAVRYPDNDANSLYGEMTTTYDVRDINQVSQVLEGLPASNFSIGQDYEKIENARKLSTTEYTLNPRLGYISLNTALNADEVLAVAYEFTVGGEVYQVGEFSSDGVNAPGALIVKLIKGTSLTPKLPTWDFMMKNVYAIGAYQINPDNFHLDIVYMNDEAGTGVNYLSEGRIKDQILLRVLNLDNLNSQLDPVPDGMFDFLNGITINPTNGRLFFPVLEPFGSYLRQKIGDDKIADKYVFQELYDSTRTKAIQIAEKNKFRMTGTYQSASGSEISLNAANVPEGSVVVTAGGIKLTENVDYTVDYTLGRIKIINQGLLESGTPIRVSLESNQLFNIQTKTLVGTHLDYKISDQFNIGATLLNLTERPLTQKVNIGNEPISNTIWGVNTSFSTESRFLTSMVDLLPFYETKQPSNITFFGEFAHLIPGHSRAIEKEGNSYIDDFEGSETPIDLKSLAAWVHASTPQGQEHLFPEAKMNNDLRNGYNRSLLAWYVIDPLFLRNYASTPSHIKNNPDLQSSHYVREVFEKEIWPNKESPSGIPTNIAVLNLSFYPDEKGPYNYDVLPTLYSSGIDENGRLRNPVSRWGGIMREVPMNDFEASNIQFIEFWLMDPFVEDSLNPGGDIYMNLGNISEDILRDSRKSFENGLPTNEAEMALVDTTAWGRVPVTQSLVKAFDQPSRSMQDIGLDGLNDDQEAGFFAGYVDSVLQTVLNPEAREALQTDPSNDNFHYFRGSDYDALELGILDRYKKYNGLEGNSPAFEDTREDYPTSGSTLPNDEDINRDNTLNETESYFQYKVSLRKDDMVVGRNYITNIVTSDVKFANGVRSKVNWYQFRIPLTDYENVIGNIQDFKSIRFFRLFLKNFEKQTHLRFARLDLIRSEWRKYNISFFEGGERISGEELSDGTFEIGSVNIEENGAKDPVNYILPPGISRVIDPTNPQLMQLNEQSILLKVREIADGDARAAFKNVTLDIREYRKLEMEVHGEALPGVSLYDDELRVFIRLGSDYRNNYYEYELPLKLTPPGDYSNSSSDDRLVVWPEENRFDIDLEIFQKVKQARNNEMNRPGSELTLSDVYSITEGVKRISVAGNPNLSNIRTIMIGVRNPLKQLDPANDDGGPKSGEIWLNELRLTHFNEKGGWAANARLTARLADLGTVDIAGSTSTPGFGSIEKKVSERSKEEIMQYDVSSNLELGRLLPNKVNIRIPMYVGISEGIVNPQYNPLDPDIPLKAALDNAATDEERNEIRRNAQEYTRRRSINFTNVKLEKTSGKPHLWDLSNLAFSYAYNETYERNIKTEIQLQKNYRGSVSYVFNTTPKNVAPFQKMQVFRSPIFALIRDFNFNYMPSHIAFRTEVFRYYDELKLRNINNPEFKIDPTFKKDFEWNMLFDLKFDLTRMLKIDFSSDNTARIDEPEGGVDKVRYRDHYDEWKDSVLTNIKKLGRSTAYHHTLNINYTLPINKFPLLNWVSVSARYNATFGWEAGTLFPDSMNINLGNIVRNSNTAQLTGQFNLTNLYNKVGFLKKVNQRYNSQGRIPKKEKEYKTVTFRIEGAVLRENIPRTIIHKLMTEDVTVKAYDQKNQEIEGTVEIVDERRVRFTSPVAYRGVRFVVEGKIEKKESPLVIITDNMARLFMSMKNLSVTYSQTEGTILPGYLPEARFFTLGMDKFNGTSTPGLPFILGWQDNDFLRKAADNEWLTKDSLLTSPYSMNHNNNITIRATLEPVTGMRIDLTANRRFTRNMDENFEFIPGMNTYDFTGMMMDGNFSMTFITWGTAFKKISKSTQYASETFRKFRDYTEVISRRKAGKRIPNSDYGYDPGDTYELNGKIFHDGYGPTSQDVLIPAFLAAYANRNPEKITLNLFPSFINMLPNWRITYDGLSRLEFIQRYLRSVTISHQYRSTYDIGAYTTNLAYTPEDDGFSYVRDKTGNNFLPKYTISAVSINEQFAPLIDFEMNWKNSLTSRIEIKRSRNLSMSFANNQLTDISSNEYVVGAGYRFDQVQFIIRTGGQEREFKSDLNVRVDLSLRDNKTVLRKLVEEQDQITAGQKRLTLKLTADYVLSDRFNLRLFFDKDIARPYVYRTFATSNTNFGFSVRFTLTQ